MLPGPKPLGERTIISAERQARYRAAHAADTADTRHVYATYDPGARMWWAESDDLPGLVSEAPTLDESVERVMAVAGELLIANEMTAAGVSLEFSVMRQMEVA